VAYLAVGGKFIVYKKIEAGVHSLKIYINRFFGKNLTVNFKISDIEAAGILVRNVRRVYRKRISSVCVMRNIVSPAKLGLPAFRHGQLIHTVAGKVGCCKIVRTACGRVVFKKPLSAKRSEKRAVFTVIRAFCIRKRRRGIVVGYKISSRFLAAVM